MRFLAFIWLEASEVVSDGSGRRAVVFGLGGDDVLRLRRAREGFGWGVGVARGRVIGGWRAGWELLVDGCSLVHVLAP